MENPLPLPLPEASARILVGKAKPWNSQPCASWTFQIGSKTLRSAGKTGEDGSETLRDVARRHHDASRRQFSKAPTQQNDEKQLETNIFIVFDVLVVVSFPLSARPPHLPKIALTI